MQQRLEACFLPSEPAPALFRIRLARIVVVRMSSEDASVEGLSQVESHRALRTRAGSRSSIRFAAEVDSPGVEIGPDAIGDGVSASTTPISVVGALFT